MLAVNDLPFVEILHSETGIDGFALRARERAKEKAAC